MKKHQALIDAASPAKTSKRGPASTPVSPGQQKQRQENRVGKKVISGYFDPAVSKQLRQLGVSEEKTVQELLSIALNNLFKEFKLPEIA